MLMLLPCFLNCMVRDFFSKIFTKGLYNTKTRDRCGSLGITWDKSNLSPGPLHGGNKHNTLGGGTLGRC